MIHDATEALVARDEFSRPQKMADDYGTIGYLLDGPSGRYVVVAKEYAYDGLASFMARLVTRASDNDKFVFYCKDDDSYTVFDAEYLKEEGTPSQGPSKKRDCSWVECPLENGAALEAYLRGTEQPRTIAGDNKQLTTFA